MITMIFSVDIGSRTKHADVGLIVIVITILLIANFVHDFAIVWNYYCMLFPMDVVNK